jgi:IMP cyclohydrolase
MDSFCSGFTCDFGFRKIDYNMKISLNAKIVCPVLFVLRIFRGMLYNGNGTKRYAGGIMKNPNGPYPGRQLFVGLTSEKKPCFAYLITGRSPASRERFATQVENTIRIGPIGNVQYDPLRHYSAVKYDSTSGVLAVSNGIQTEAVFETYKLLFNTANQPGKEYLEKILEGAGSEPDPPLNTARIAGVITNDPGGNPIFAIGIKAFNHPAKAWQIEPEGDCYGTSTYKERLRSRKLRFNSAPPC